MRTRSALLRDAEAIHELIATYSGDGTLLPRTVAEICENIRDFTVVEGHGEVIACGALHLYGPHLAEVRSIAVRLGAKGKGAGHKVVKALLHEAERQEVSGVCLFTRIPEFFASLGFTIANREDLPDKIYKDCLACPKLHCCDEIAMVRGELPKYAFLHQHHIGHGLVKFEA